VGRGGGTVRRGALKGRLYQRKEILLAIGHGIASKERGTGTGFGDARAVGPCARIKVEPMVVNNPVGVDGDVEPLAKRGRYRNNGVLLLGVHGVFPCIKIAQVLDANGMAVVAQDTGGGAFQAAPGANFSIRKDGKVLPNVAPAVIMDMVIFHGFLKVEMVIAPKIAIIGRKGVVLLYVEDGPGQVLCVDPGFKFVDGHEGKPKLSFHNFSN